MEPLTIKEFIDLASKGFTLNTRKCALCDHLPMEKVCEVTLDIIFNRRTFVDMQRHYAQFAINGRVLGEHNFRHHRDKCCKGVSAFTDEDKRKLGVLEDEAEILQALYDMKYEEALNPVTLKKELRRQRIHNLSIFEKQRKELESNVRSLEQGILPKTLEGLFQVKSGSIPEPLNLLRLQENSHLLTITKQIDVIQSDMEKNAALAEKAEKANTMVIQVMNSSITDMESQFKAMLYSIKTALDVLLPNQPEVVTQVFRIICNHMNSNIIPVLEKTKEVLLIESK